ncbi:SCO1664 family protein [Nakamurella antarctica]|uniref:SCO1664 family protein n=1 Tax=Nakamurella antarctica TaxID=1902245 RepID=A0A3G8ZKX4_9ACTN|nr:SCO1664 family protein [Nakamurella antarctica]AZI57962.1 SCO1664 family protein [Nakamurella antarctica]
MGTTAVTAAKLDPAEDAGLPTVAIPDLTPDQLADVLVNGELEIRGRLTDASNLTALAVSTLGGVSVECVYKPVRGERPLWDFPDGSLAAREVGSAMIARAAQWNCVPPTYLREGPLGEGMVQQWIDGTDQDDTVNIFKPSKLPKSWLPVLRAADERGRPLVLAHADTPELALLATFDMVVNNADRKAPHILPVTGGPVLGVDHGLTLHYEDKLRTVLWGWAGREIPEEGVEGLHRLTEQLEGALGEDLSALITITELRALCDRVAHLVESPLFTHPPQHRSPIPWPAL